MYNHFCIELTYAVLSLQRHFLNKCLLALLARPWCSFYVFFETRWEIWASRIITDFDKPSFLFETHFQHILAIFPKFFIALDFLSSLELHSSSWKHPCKSYPISTSLKFLLIGKVYFGKQLPRHQLPIFAKLHKHVITFFTITFFSQALPFLSTHNLIKPYKLP